MMQAVAAQTDLPKLGEKSGDDSDFQKLLAQKAQSAKEDGKTEEQPKEESTPSRVKEEPEQEDGVTRAKRLIQSGLVQLDPDGRRLIGLNPVIGREMLTQNVGQTPLVTDAAAEVIAETGVIEAPIQVPVQQEQVPAEVLPQTQAQEVVEEVQPQEVQVQPQQVEQRTEVVVEDAVQTVRSSEEELQPQEDNDIEVVDAEQAPRRVFEDVKAAPVKVGETYRSEEAQQPDVASQIDQKLAQALQKGESQVRVQLNPESLGSVTVEISQSADGILRVALSAHSGETRGLLERHAAHLQGMLADRTQQTVQVEVQRQQESQQGQNHSYDGHNGHSQGGQQHQPRREHSGSQDFFQQLRLGLIPMETEDED